MQALTASRKKLGLSPSFISIPPDPNPVDCSPSTDPSRTVADDVTGDVGGDVGVGYRFIKLEELAVALKELGVCKFCKSPLGIFEPLVVGRVDYEDNT